MTDERMQSIYTSYAKDVFIALIEKDKGTQIIIPKDFMMTAIELIKQAKEAFKD